MIALTQIANTETFAFIVVPVFKLLSRKFLFTNRKDDKTVKIRLFFKKIENFIGKLIPNYK